MCMVDARIWTAPRGLAYCGPAAMSPPPPDHQTSDSAPSCGKLHNPLIQPMLDAPHAFYARARREEPIFFSEAAGAWILTRHEDICAIARDVARFSSVGILDGGPGMPPEVIAELMRGFPPVRGIVDSDAPYHTRVRALANKALSLRRTAAFEPRIRAIAEQLIDGFVERGHVELVRAFALPLPGSFIVDLFGFPREDLALFSRWSDDWIGFASYSDAPLEKIVGHARGMVEFQHHLAAAIKDRQEHPRDDALSDLVSDDGGPPLSLGELVNTAVQIIFAGHETTAGLITAAAAALASDSALAAAARDDAALRDGVVEEAARTSSLVHSMFRYALADVELHGTTIRRGDRVQLVWISGNRDENQFADPQRFDATRKGPHIAFGHGPHYCLGAPLARLEARIAVETLLRRLPGLRLADDRPLEHVAGPTVRRIKALELAWDRG